MSVGCGWLVLVVAGLHLHAVSDESSESIATDLARKIEAWVGPGVLVLTGDTFALRDEPNNSPRRALAAHPRMHDAFHRFASGLDHQVVLVAGGRDAPLLTSAPVAMN